MILIICIKAGSEWHSGIFGEALYVVVRSMNSGARSPGFVS